HDQLSQSEHALPPPSCIGGRCCANSRALPARGRAGLRSTLGKIQTAHLRRMYPALTKTLHARIMASVEQLYADRRIEQRERLAHHALRGEVWDKALASSRQAAEKATGRSALRETWSHLEQAIAVLPHLPQTQATLEQAVDLRLAARTCLGPVGELTRRIQLELEAEALAKALN